MYNIDYLHLDHAQQRLLDAAAKAMETAYNPYSSFYVGAALLAQNGKIITGANVENAAYGSCICAERSALVRANAMNIRRFEKVTVIARAVDAPTSEVTAPCGGCRQMLYEAAQLSDKDLEVIMSTTKKDKIVIAKMSELLPLASGPKDLGINLAQYRGK